MFHVFVDDNQINNKNIIIANNEDAENYNHLKKSVRIKINELILVSINGFKQSFDYLTKVIDIDDEKIILDILEKSKSKELKYKINLYQGMPKSDKMEFIIEKAVELGVFSIIPVDMDFSISKFNDKNKSSKILRYNKISKSASEQSKRSIIPEVRDNMNFSEMIMSIKNDRFNILFYENAEGIELTHKFINDLKNNIVENENINIIIGPEGGFSDKEIELAKNNNVHILSLGERILRTETAAISSLSIFMYELE